MNATWRVRSGSRLIDKPIVFGILNVTPDSFSDGGIYNTPDAALDHARAMITEGADGIDIGGESTRPQGATAVTAEEELRRVLPVLTAIRNEFSHVLLSVDTSKAAVASAVLRAGADAINDVSAFRIDPRIGEIAAAEGAGVVLMHSRGGVAEMGTYRFATYDDHVVEEVVRELQLAVDSALATGVMRDSIVLDPGIGFAKRSEHSLRVLAELGQIAALGYPVMVGTSRKRFVGELSGVDRPENRIAGTVGANVTALTRGARLFRVHDVAPTRQALDVAWAILQAERSSSSMTS